MTTVTHTIPTVVVGSNFRRPEARSAVALMKPGDVVLLIREPANPHDKLAVGCHYLGRHVGYIPRQANPEIARAIDRGCKIRCTVREAAVLNGPVVRVEPKLTVTWEEA
jgi:hypothetical protein